MTKYNDPKNPPPHVPLWDNEGDRWEPNGERRGRPLWSTTPFVARDAGASWAEMSSGQYAPFTDVDPHVDAAPMSNRVELRAEEMTGPQHYQAANELLDLYADAARDGAHSPDAPILAIAHALQALTAATAANIRRNGGTDEWNEVTKRG